MNIFNFRHICLLCHQSTRHYYDLCFDCQKNLPVYADQTELNNAQQTYSIISPFYYAFPIAHLISQLKFHNKLIYAKLLGQLLAQHIKKIYKKNSLPELIIPIPLHKKRLQERGFNQALEIAKSASKLLNIKINTSSCIRKKHTTPQTALNSSERRKNIKNSFALTQPIPAKHIAILDDVITTGETSRELANLLAQSGPYKIDLWSCARTDFMN